MSSKKELAPHWPTDLWTYAAPSLGYVPDQQELLLRMREWGGPMAELGYRHMSRSPEKYTTRPEQMYGSRNADGTVNLVGGNVEYDKRDQTMHMNLNYAQDPLKTLEHESQHVGQFLARKGKNWDDYIGAGVLEAYTHQQELKSGRRDETDQWSDNARDFHKGGKGAMRLDSTDRYNMELVQKANDRLAAEAQWQLFQQYGVGINPVTEKFVPEQVQKLGQPTQQDMYARMVENL